VFHAALAYGPYFSNIWFVADPDSHVGFTYFALWSHLFRMPLFFLIAGFCAVLLIEKRGSKAFISNRLKRVLLPFIAFLPITLALIFHVITWGEKIADPLPPLFNVFKLIQDPPISTMHLWFLWNLMQLCLLVWLLSLYKQVYSKVLSIVVRPLFLGILLPIIIFTAMFNQMVPFPAADKVYPELWSYGLYGTMFLVGAGFYHHHELLAEYFKRLNVLFLLAVASTIVYFVVLPAPLTIEQVVEAANAGGVVKLESINIVALASQTIAIVTWTAVALLAGFKWLNQRNEFSAYMSNASYWLYLIHVPLLIYIQLPLINVSLPAGVKLSISVGVTMIVGLSSYHLFVRNTLIGVFLNGKKARA
jgi:glucan biosynthesis protein C